MLGVITMIPLLPVRCWQMIKDTIFVLFAPVAERSTVLELFHTTWRPCEFAVFALQNSPHLVVVATNMFRGYVFFPFVKQYILHPL